MPRPLRIRGDAIHYHIILRCNNRERLIQQKSDFERLLNVLNDVRKKHDFKLYNYDILNSHLHLLLSTHNNVYVDRIMHEFCFKYAKDYNWRHDRMGHFWAHRYRSHVIDDDRYALACLRYQHRNVLAAGIVSKLEDWPWSGYSFYAFGRADELLEMHPVYQALSDNSFIRQRVYRELVKAEIPADKKPDPFENRKRHCSKRLSKTILEVDKVRCALVKSYNIS